MDRETGRRAFLATALGAGVAGGFLTPATNFLNLFAPLSGSTWKAARAGRQSTVKSPYGDAAVRYDDDGVPNITADDERALYFAVGYVQGSDRLFQMELQRRLFSGRLSEIVGEATLESDKFHRKMQFRTAAEATTEHLQESAPPAIKETCEAYVDGVNAAIEEESLPLEFRLLEYEPEEWTLTDSVLVEKLMGWALTGSFRTLRKALIRDRFSAELADQLYPHRFETPDPILRDHHDFETFGSAQFGEPTDENTVEKGLVDWLTAFEPEFSMGSNSWAVNAELADGDAPIVCNDPHLTMQAPPVWYELHVDGPNHRIRGVTFPGVPYVILGENDHGAWSFTNAGADGIDFYTYDEHDDGTTYQYGDERRAFEFETEAIEVAGGETETIERKRSVHGPVIEEAEQEVGIAWIGHAATETMIAAYKLTHSTGMAAAEDAVKQFEVPTQNFVYADRDGNTMYHMIGRHPVRRTDGEAVRGDQIFSAADREGEWRGFEPFTRPTAWDEATAGDAGDTTVEEYDVVPFSAKPHLRNFEYIATANQEIVPKKYLEYYLGDGFAPRWRGERIYNLMDEQIEAGNSFDLDVMAEIGRDKRDGRAAAFVPDLIEAAREADDPALEDAAATLEDWEYQMRVDSEAALLFAVWADAYRTVLFEEQFEAEGLGEEYYPSWGAIAEFPPESAWYQPRGRRRSMRVALREALATIEAEGYETFGDRSHTGAIDHPLGGELPFLNYPSYQRGGTSTTVMNFGIQRPWGGPWEMQVDLDGEYRAILGGGNAGRYFSKHYDDQLERWANGEYRTLSREISGDLVTTFEEGDR